MNPNARHLYIKRGDCYLVNFMIGAAAVGQKPVSDAIWDTCRCKAIKFEEDADTTAIHLARLLGARLVRVEVREEWV